jgi:hypothetical protein
MLRPTLYWLGLATLALGVTMLLSPAQGHASGGGGETIKVNKCEYAVTIGYVELLISASSSNPNAFLLAYLPDGSLLGPVHNGGHYGGTVFLSMDVPDTITIVSSSGAHTTVPCVPYQP